MYKVLQCTAYSPEELEQRLNALPREFAGACSVVSIINVTPHRDDVRYQMYRDYQIVVEVTG